MEPSPEETAVPPTSAPAAPRYRGRAAAIAALTVFAGPPLGALPFYGLLFGALFSGESAPATSAEFLETALKVTLFIALYSYVLGGFQALVAAGLMAFLTLRRGTVSYRDTALIALFASAVAAVAIFLIDPSMRKGDVAGNASFAGLLAAFSLLAAVLCRFIAGRIGIYPRA